MYHYHVILWAMLILCATSCFGIPIGFVGKPKARPFVGKKVEDSKTNEMIKKEIASWKDAPELLRLKDVGLVEDPNQTVYEIRYVAQNNDTCEGTYTKTKLPGNNKYQTSHEFECYKEDMKRRRLHNVLDHDTPMFDDQDTGDVKGAENRKRKKPKKKEDKNKNKFVEEYEGGNVSDVT